MAVTIETDHLKAIIDEKGAELVSLKSKTTDIEYIWQADPTHWKRHAPVLFPIVGKLKNDTYQYQGKNYHLSQHGFARDKDFTLVEQTKDKVRFSLKSDEETKQVYPFEFELIVGYQMLEDGISVSYEVVNPVDETLYFSVGGHPAFNIPLEENLSFEDYFLETNPTKSRIRIPLKEGLTDVENRTLGQTNTTLALNHDLFKNDALILETLGTNSFTLRNEQSRHGVRVSFKDLPYVGIWSTYPLESPFVCIEPWAGLADTYTSTGKLEEKLGIQKLAAKDTFKTGYEITVK